MAQCDLDTLHISEMLLNGSLVELAADLVFNLAYESGNAELVEKILAHHLPADLPELVISGKQLNSMRKSLGKQLTKNRMPEVIEILRKQAADALEERKSRGN